MPHKHKRKRDEDASNFDLAPTSRAKPLPAYSVPSVFTKDTPSNKRRKPNAQVRSKKSVDDTPKSFARLMAWQASGGTKRPSALDDGNIPTTKNTKKAVKQKPTTKDGEMNNGETAKEGDETDVNSESQQPKLPEIKPGESLSEFALRVDQSMPLSSIAKSSSSSTNNNNNPQTQIPEDIKPKVRLTKHNKRLQKMIADWRTTDARLKQKQEEEASDETDEDDDNDGTKHQQNQLWNEVKAARSNRKGKKKNNRTMIDKDDEDPWKALEKKKREETRQKNLQDVVVAPPELKKVKSKFKVMPGDLDSNNNNKNDSGNGGGRNEEGKVMLGVDVKNVPNSVGSLRKREEMNSTRRAVIEGYRKMRREKNARATKTTATVGNGFRSRGVVT